MCRKEIETVEHLCLIYEWTRGVWCAGGWGIRIQKESITRIDRWIGSLFCNKEVTWEMKMLIAYKLWYIWKGRCEVSLGGEQLNINGVYKRVARTMEEILVATNNKKLLSSEIADGHGEKERRKKPEEGWIKLNSDGAWKEKEKNGNSRDYSKKLSREDNCRKRKNC